MNRDAMKALLRSFLDAFEVNDLDAMRDMLSADFVSHQVGAPGPLDRESLMDHIAGFNAAFSDQHYTVHDQLVDGDKVVTRATWRGTHTGEFAGVAPTDKEMSITAITIDQIRDGKIVERWLNHDVLALLQQLGLVPLPEFDN